MIKNGECGAFACASDGAHQAGLTKREYFAGLAMQGMLANPEVIKSISDDKIITYSLKYSDILLKELEKDGSI